MNICNINLRIIFQIFSEFCNKDIHATTDKIIIVAPYGFKCIFACEQLIFIQA